MSDETVEAIAPEEIDETTSMEVRRLSTSVGLRGRPVGNQRCGNCRYYLEDTADISYCWFPKVRILVGESWWCERWEQSTDL